ncbi:hypothetical protein ACJH6H_28975 [Mycobacterium sp. SMC-21]
MPSTDAIRKVLESEQLVDELAAVEHERWAHWQRYVSNDQNLWMSLGEAA